MAIVVSKVKVQLSVALRRKYQLEASLDLKTRSATGVPFVAKEEELAQEFDVALVGQYFRISQVPQNAVAFPENEPGCAESFVGRNSMVVARGSSRALEWCCRHLAGRAGLTR